MILVDAGGKSQQPIFHKFQKHRKVTRVKIKINYSYESCVKYSKLIKGEKENDKNKESKNIYDSEKSSSNNSLNRLEIS